MSHEKILLTITILVLFCIVIFWQKRYGAAAEFTVFIPDFKKDQDVRLKVGYEIFDKVIIIFFLGKGNNNSLFDIWTLHLLWCYNYVSNVIGKELSESIQSSWINNLDYWMKKISLYSHFIL